MPPMAFEKRALACTHVELGRRLDRRGEIVEPRARNASVSASRIRRTSAGSCSSSATISLLISTVPAARRTGSRRSSRRRARCRECRSGARPGPPARSGRCGRSRPGPAGSFAVSRPRRYDSRLFRRSRPLRAAAAPGCPSAAGSHRRRRRPRNRFAGAPPTSRHGTTRPRRPRPAAAGGGHPRGRSGAHDSPTDSRKSARPSRRERLQRETGRDERFEVRGQVGRQPAAGAGRAGR